LLLSVTCALAIGTAALLLGGRTVPSQLRVPAAFVFVALAAFSGIGIPGAGGTRMIERFSDAKSDAQERSSHWAEALNLMTGDWTNYLFGMGLGRFPDLEFRQGHPIEPRTSYHLGSDPTRNFLAFDHAGANITQKVPLQPHTQYRLSFAMRSSRAGSGVVFKFCPQLILLSDRYTPQCLEYDFKAQRAGSWETHDASIDSGVLGANGLYYWPTTLQIWNIDDPTDIQISDVHVSDGQNDIIANGDFADGIDRWIQISDFEHLNWHIKNIYVEIFFENGALGLIIFLGALGIAMISAFKAALGGDPIGIGAAGAFVGFLLLGFVASAFDNPRPALMFFILLLWMLQRVGHDRKQLSSPRP